MKSKILRGKKKKNQVTKSVICWKYDSFCAIFLNSISSNFYKVYEIKTIITLIYTVNIVLNQKINKCLIQYEAETLQDTIIL